MLDRYFRNPLLYDYSLGLLISISILYIYIRGYFKLPKIEYTLSTSSDLSTISLTLAGFILTLLTILITFKAGSKIDKSVNPEKQTIFDLFFVTNLYFETTKHLKNCIKSLLFISVLGYSLKLLLSESLLKYLFFSNSLGLVILVLTLLRSLLILTRIIDLQKDN